MTDPRFIAGVAAGLKAAAGVADAQATAYREKIMVLIVEKRHRPQSGMHKEALNRALGCDSAAAAIRAIDPATIEEDVCG